MTTGKTTGKTVPATAIAFIKRHPVLSYYLLTFAISWGGILLVIVIGHSGLLATSEQFNRLLPFAIPALLGGPSIAGLLLTGIVSGRAGYHDLWDRLRLWRVGAGWYAVALLATPLVFLVVALALSRFSPIFVPTIFSASDKASPLLFGIVWGLVVGFCEELGWTGFAIPRLRLRYSMLTTGLIVGLFWAAWHLLAQDVWGSARLAGSVPMALFLTANGVSFLVGQLPAYRVLMVWVYERTGGSLLIAMLMHASLTACAMILGAATMGGAFLIAGFVTDAVWWLIVAAVLITSAVAQGGQLVRQLRQELHRQSVG